MNRGYIKLWRALTDKPIWKQSTPEQKVILITLMTMANHSRNEWEWRGDIIRIRPGQFVTSLDSIAKKAGKGISTQNVRTALKRFEKLQFLTNESTKTGRLISLVNWHIYQGESDKANNDAHKDLTKTQQRPNKDLTPNKNDKNDKNNKNDKNDIKYPKGYSESSKKIPQCPHEKIISFYHKILPSLPQIQVWNGTSEKNLKTRWKEDPQRQSLEFWKAFFEYIAKSEFLMGKKTDWQCDLMWIVKANNFAKIINGTYHKGNKLTTALQDHNRRVLEDFINE